MSLKKISFDLELALNPHKLLLLISGLDNLYSEIYCPTNLKILQYRPPQFGPPMSYDTFQPMFKMENKKLISIKDTFEPFLENKKITPDNFFAGLLILNRAVTDGLIKLKEFDGYIKTGKKFIADKMNFKEDYHLFPEHSIVKTNNQKLLIGCDFGIGIYEGLYGAYLDEEIYPIFGDGHLFQKEENNQSFNSNKIEELKWLLQFPSLEKLDDYYSLAKKGKLLIDGFNELKSTDFSNKYKRELIEMTLKFSGTLATDILIFQGLPVTSGVLFGYELIKKIVDK